MKLVTSFIYPPIPDRHHDWCAYDADEEGDGPTGYGETEAEALKDFICNALEHYETLAYAEGRKDQFADDFEKAARLMNETGQGEHMGAE